MARKRKIEEPDEEKEEAPAAESRLSRKERLAASKERARLSMGVASKKKPAARTAASQTTRTTARASRAATAAAKKKAPVDDDEDSDDGNRKKRPSKRARLEEGRSRAAAWNEEMKRNARKKPSPARRKPAVASLDSDDEEMAEAKREEETKHDDDAAMEEPQEPFVSPQAVISPPVAVPPAATAPSPATASHAYTGPAQMHAFYATPVAPGAFLTNQAGDCIAPPPSSFSSTVASPDEMPPPGLQRQSSSSHVVLPPPGATPFRQPAPQDVIQQKVLANLEAHMNHRPLPFTEPEEADVVEEDRRSSRRNWSMVATILVAIASVVAGALIYSDGSFFTAKDDTKPALKKPHLPPCFQDTFPDPNITFDGRYCHFDPEAGLQPCPPKGTCIAGILTMCNDPAHYVMLDAACRLNAESNATLDAIEKLLIAWTTDHICKFEGCPYAVEGQEETRFALSNVFGELNMTWDMVPLGSGARPHLVVDVQDSDLVLVGLAEDYVRNEMELPFLCSIAKSAVALASFGFEFLQNCASYVAYVSTSLIFYYPGMSLFGLFVLAFFKWKEIARRRRLTFLREITNARQIVFDRLGTRGRHKALHIRDEIANELYPDSRLERDRFMKKVWPKVAKDIREDNRVLKSKEADEQGNVRDVWQWTAASPAPRHVHFAR